MRRGRVTHRANTVITKPDVLVKTGKLASGWPRGWGNFMIRRARFFKEFCYATYLPFDA